MSQTLTLAFLRYHKSRGLIRAERLLKQHRDKTVMMTSGIRYRVRLIGFAICQWRRSICRESKYLFSTPYPWRRFR